MALQWFGAGYLTYIAYGIWKSAEATPSGFRGNPIPPQSSAKTSLFAGLLFNLSNPKAIMFYLALMPNLVSVEEMSLLGFVELAIVLSAVLLTINSAYSFLAVKFRSLLTSEKTTHLINRLACLGLLGIALLMIVR